MTSTYTRTEMGDEPMPNLYVHVEKVSTCDPKIPRLVHHIFTAHSEISGVIVVVSADDQCLVISLYPNIFECLGWRCNFAGCTVAVLGCAVCGERSPSQPEFTNCYDGRDRCYRCWNLYRAECGKLGICPTDGDTLHRVTSDDGLTSAVESGWNYCAECGLGTYVTSPETVPGNVADDHTV